MADFKIKVDGKTFVVRQSLRDVVEGIKRNDPGRITVASGNKLSLHVGTTSQTLGRGSKPFGRK